FNARILVDGKETGEENTWLYRYSLRATREGRLQLPALDFGNSRTRPISIMAGRPESSDRMRLGLKLSKSRVHLGEPVMLTVEWDSTAPFSSVKAVDFHFPVLNDTRFQVIDLYEPEKEQQASTTGLPVHGTRILATRKNYEDDGTTHQSLSFSKLLIPQKTGSLDLQPAAVLCAVGDDGLRNDRSAFQYPAYFDNTFFDQNVTGDNWTRIYTESAPVVLEVTPLPLENRPALFNGMVGDFSITATAEPLNVRVGDPVTLTVTITAAAYMENIFFPTLRYQPLLANRFEIAADRSLPQRKEKSKIYTQTIRPLSADISAIPSLHLAYFSPSSNAYVTVQTEAIPLAVLPGEDVRVYGGPLHQSRLHSAEGGIRQNYEDPDMLKSMQRPLFGWANPVAVISFVIVPPLVFGCISLLSLLDKKRHHIRRTAKSARAYTVFRRNVAHISRSHVSKSEIYGDLDRMLRAYLGDRLHLNPGALSFRDAEHRLMQAGAEEETVGQVRDLFMLCESCRFTSGFEETADAKEIVHHAVHLIKALEKSLK
ncbi:MAG TPA: hypothetical protein VIR77_00490, partial [Pontiella sp.]